MRFPFASLAHRPRWGGLVRHYVAPGARAILAGSPASAEARLLARLVGPTGSVICFDPAGGAAVQTGRSGAVVQTQAALLLHREPTVPVFLPNAAPPVPSAGEAWRHFVRETKRLLRRNQLLVKGKRALDRFRPARHPAAASEAPSPADLVAGPQGRTRQPVAWATVDAFVQAPGARVDLLCSCASGYEVLFLLGALRTLHTHRPPVVLSLCDWLLGQTDYTAHHALQLLTARGYLPCWPDGEMVLDPETFDETIQREPNWPFQVVFLPCERAPARPVSIILGERPPMAVPAPASPPPLVGAARPVSRRPRPARCRYVIAYTAGGTYMPHLPMEASMQSMGEFEQALARHGHVVKTFCTTLDPLEAWLPWSWLDARWRARDPRLLAMYDRLGALLAEADVLIAVCTANLHPEFLRTLKLVKVIRLSDDPEASEHQSRPVAPAYDLVFYCNPAVADMYRSWGLGNCYYMPTGFHLCEADPTVTAESIRRGGRPTDLVFLGARDFSRDRRLLPLLQAFPQTLVYGRRWPAGSYPEATVGTLYTNTKIGWNFDQSMGPVSHRTFVLPANGVLMLTDNRAFMDGIYVHGREAIGFDTIPEAIEYTRYYLAHEPERLAIAEAGWVRAHRDYRQDVVWARALRQVEETFFAPGNPQP